MAKDHITAEEYYLGVGQIIHLASYIDIFLYETFELISGCPSMVARAIFFTLDAYSVKRTLIMRTAEVTCSSDQIELVKLVLKAGESANRQRQRVAHIPIASDATGVAMRVTFRNPHHITESMSRHEMARIIQVLNGRLECARAHYRKLVKTRKARP